MCICTYSCCCHSNTSSSDVIDFHGLFVKEAIEALEETLSNTTQSELWCKSTVGFDWLILSSQRSFTQSLVRVVIAAGAWLRSSRQLLIT